MLHRRTGKGQDDEAVGTQEDRIRKLLVDRDGGSGRTSEKKEAERREKSGKMVGKKGAERKKTKKPATGGPVLAFSCGGTKVYGLHSIIR